MKKALLLMITCLMAMSMHAQNEHMKFMGIPLNGTIAAFQSKLQAKGIKYDAKMSAEIKDPCRAFHGVFSGYDADIYVYYNEKTKVVYRAKAVIKYNDKEIGESKFSDFKYNLKNKYANAYSYDGEQNDHPSLSLNVPDSKEERQIGTIDLYITNALYSFMDEVYLHVDYTDTPNKKVNEKENWDDL